MFAVIKTGGKQYRVAVEDKLKVEKVSGEPGEIVQFGEVLVVGGDTTTLGTPTVAERNRETDRDASSSKQWGYARGWSSQPTAMEICWRREIGSSGRTRTYNPSVNSYETAQSPKLGATSG